MQIEHKIACFFVLFATVYFLESIGGFYMTSAITYIEKQFQIPSKLSGMMVSASDFAYIPVVVFTSYFGGQGNRARWIGGGCMLIAIADLLISSSNFLFPVEEYYLNNTSLPNSLVYEINRFVLNDSSDPNWFNKTLEEIDPKGVALDTIISPNRMHSEDFHKMHTEEFMRYQAYCYSNPDSDICSSMEHDAEECKKDKSNSGPFLMIFGACMFFAKILGPVLGLLLGSKLNEIYYTFDPPHGLTPLDPMWIGCWWLGFVIFGVILFFPSLALFLFPSDRLDESNVSKVYPKDATIDGTAPLKPRKTLNLYDKHVKIHGKHVTAGEKMSGRRAATWVAVCSLVAALMGFANGAVGCKSVIGKIGDQAIAVPPEHRSISLGFHGFLVSLLATLPSPVFWGKIFDMSCLMWQNVCTKTGACPIYDTDELRIRLHVIYGSLRLLALFSDIWVVYWAKGLKLVDEEDESTKTSDGGDTQELGPLTKGGATAQLPKAALAADYPSKGAS
ncbi:organic Anion Transporter Polypeptide family protein [Teladorsagia circumcincta]|uniref:Organic Anion Transporter Polypeptide family protein n=1 Tax=Teladorsagia circumcincta TaxID=45464 RepID=A0A2G9UGS5_TELCI|nr:organic Anion Transporter Polypeptide family protein [Teladorsagia circumcincta]